MTVALLAVALHEDDAPPLRPFPSAAPSQFRHAAMGVQKMALVARISTRGAPGDVRRLTRLADFAVLHIDNSQLGVDFGFTHETLGHGLSPSWHELCQ